MKHFLIPILLLTSWCVSGQNFDSLRYNITLAQAEGNDSVTMERMLDLAFEHYFSYVDNDGVVSDQIVQCIEFATDHDLDDGLISIMNVKGQYLSDIGDYDASIETYDELLIFLKERRMDETAALVLDNKGGTYIRAGELDKALACKLEALEIIKVGGEAKSIAVSYSAIGALYLGKEEYRKAIEYSRLAIQQTNVSGDKTYIGYAYGNMAISYKQLNQPDSALHYFLKCRDVSSNLKLLYNDNEAALADFYVEQENFAEANAILTDLIEKFDEEKNSPSLHYYKLLYAMALLKSEQYDLAAEQFTEVDTNYLRPEHITWIKYANTGYQLEIQNSDYKEALSYYKISRDYQDSVSLVDKNVRFKEIESKYNIAEKEKVITQQDVKLKNRLIVIGGLLSLLLLGSMIYAGRIRSLRYQRQISEQDNLLKAKEIENLMQENKIISMQSMLEGQEEERRRIAQDLHDNIGSLMTTIKMKILGIQREIESIEKMNITTELDEMITTASQEVRRISHSMTPVAMDIAGLQGAVEDLDYQLSSNGIEYQVRVEDLDNITDKKLSINIFRIIQEIINNTIKHAEATVVIVDALVKDHVLHLQITDNGKGFDPTLWEQSETIGLGGIKSRIEYLGGSVILSHEDGTQYQITIPIKI